MPISKDAQRILIRAASIVKDRTHWYDRWKSGATFSDSEKVCALGALRKATVLEGFMPEGSLFNLEKGTDGHPAFEETADALAASAIPTEGGDVLNRQYIPVWNDGKGNTDAGHARVTAGFCKAIRENIEEEEE